MTARETRETRRKVPTDDNELPDDADGVAATPAASYGAEQQRRNGNDTGEPVAQTERRYTPTRPPKQEKPKANKEDQEECERLTAELEELEGRAEAARKLFENEEGDPKQGLSSMEEMLLEIDDEDQDGTGFTEVKVIERLISLIQIAALQDDLPARMGRRYGKPYGTVDSLVKEVEEMFPEETKQLKAQTIQGGRALRAVLKNFVKALSAGVGVRSMLISAVILRIWTRDDKSTHGQTVNDVGQGLCRTKVAGWREFRNRCKKAELDPKLLTDLTVVGEPGYEELRPDAGDGRNLDQAWLTLMACALEVLAYEPLAPLSKRQALEKWRITGENHSLKQRATETMRELLSRLRMAWQQLQIDLKLIGKTEALPDAEDEVENLFLAVRSDLRIKAYEKLKEQGLESHEISIELATEKLLWAEKVIGIKYWQPVEKKIKQEERKRPDAPKDSWKSKNMTKLDKAKIAFGKAAGRRIDDIEESELKAKGVDHWVAEYSRGNGKPAKTKTPGNGEKIPDSNGELMNMPTPRVVPMQWQENWKVLKDPYRRQDKKPNLAHCMADWEPSTELLAAADKVWRTTIKYDAMRRWKCRPAQRALDSFMQEARDILGGQEELPTSPSNSTMDHTSTSPRMGSRLDNCDCYTGHGSHGCRVELQDGDVDGLCMDCNVWVDGKRVCECSCDQCEEGRELDAMVEEARTGEQGAQGEQYEQYAQDVATGARRVALGRWRRARMGADKRNSAPRLVNTEEFLQSTGKARVVMRKRTVYQSLCMAAGYCEADGGLLRSAVGHRNERPLEKSSEILGRNIAVLRDIGGGHSILLQYGSEVGDPVLLVSDAGGTTYSPAVDHGRLGMRATQRRFEIQRRGCQWQVESWERDESILAGMCQKNGGAEDDARKPGIHHGGASHDGYEVEPAPAFCAFLGDETVVCGVDSYAELSLVRESKVQAGWKILEDSGRLVRGIGERDSELGRRVEVPLVLRYTSAARMVAARVTPDSMMPDGVDFLVGTKQQRVWGTDISIRDGRVDFTALGVSIVQEPSWVLRKRMKRGLRVLDLCAGASKSYAVFRDQGWRITAWDAVENNPHARAVAEALFGGKVRHVSADVCGWRCTEYYDVILAGPPCQPWSRASHNPKGFNDPRARVFAECTRIVREAVARNPNAKFMFENVEISAVLPEDGARQEELLGVKFGKVNAKDIGAPQSRPRRVATNFVDVESGLEKRRPLNPNVVLEVMGVRLDARVAPCVMAAGAATHNPVKVYCYTAERWREASLAEAEALQGYTAGMSTAYGKVCAGYKDTATIVGNAFHYELVRTVFAEMNPDRQESEEWAEPMPGAMPVQAGTAPELSKQEAMLSALDERQLEAWMKAKMVGYEMKELVLRVRDEETVPYQVPKRSRFQTPAKLRKPTLAALRQKLASRKMKLVAYDPESWISSLFVKGKGRLDPETEEEAVRFLTDLRQANAALTWPEHWNEQVPTTDGLRSEVPMWAAWFSQEDVSDAFETMRVGSKLAHMLCAASPIPLGPGVFTPEEMASWGYTDTEIEQLMQEPEWFLQWEGVPQGLAPAAPFWNVHIADAFNRIFGEEWREYWAMYVDDCMPFGATEQQCKHRQRFLTAALKVLGKKVSAKVDRTVRQEGHIAGLKFVPGGVVLNDEAVEALRLALGDDIKNEKAARRLVGILTYAASAIRWDIHDQTWFAKRKGVLTASYSGTRFSWGKDCAQVVEQLLERLVAPVRVPCRPAEMVQRGWRLVIKSDGCDRGVGACMLLVKPGENGEVTAEHMLEEDRVRLVSTDSKVLSGAQQKWLTFEIEIFGMYRALRKWAALLMQVCQQGRETWPPLLWMDSTTGVAKWASVSVPGHIDHACAKEKRFLGWAEKVAYTKWMDLDMRWIPGSANDFADLLSRMADKLHSCIEEREGGQFIPTARVLFTAPSAYETSDMMLGELGWEEVRRAYLADTGLVQSVRISDIYRCVCMEGDGVSSEMRIKIEPWVGRRYFCIEPPGGGGLRAVYTPRAQLREQWERKDETRVLVLLVPAGAMVRVTTAAAVVDAEEATEYEMLDLRRDLLLHCHDNAGHPRPGPTLTAVKLLAYWPTMGVKGGKDSVQRHWDLCAHCTSMAELVEEHGLGVESTRRMEVLMIDHMILTDEHAAEAGAIGSLTMVDLASRMGIFAAAQSQTAEHTAELIMEYWVPYFGVPAVLVSDPASGFASEVMRAIRQIMGIAEHDFAAARAKGKVAIVERAHRLVRSVLADGFSKGDIQSLGAFKMYLSMAAQKRNQFERPGKVTPVELWSGQRVRTMQSMVLVSEDIEVPEQTDEEETAFVRRLRNVTQDLMEYEHHLRDDVARKNAMRRDKDDQMTKHGLKIRLDMQVGDMVSHEGKKVKIEALHGEPDRPVTATVRTDLGKEKRVRFAELRIPAASVPVKMLPKVIQLGDFVLWHDQDGALRGGTMLSMRDTVFTVWAREQDTGMGKSWLPTWTDKDGLIVRAKAQPFGMEKYTEEVDSGRIELQGGLTETHRVTESTWKAAVAQGLV
jgi:hypothetical protein